MEVRTLVGLLEMFETFECFTNNDDLLEILTNRRVDVNSSCLAVLNENCYINDIVIGGKRQIHAADSLRFVEERDYQVKKFYTIYTLEDVLLLSLRERYERFYRSHGVKYQLKFGYGLKPLMKAMKYEDQELVHHRYLEAKMKLETCPVEFADTRDLLFYISYSFIKLLTDVLNIENKEYRQLLSYSTKLLDTQREEKRPYLEAFLFYAIFHWPLKERFKFDSLSKPATYINMMDLWEERYLSNNYIKTRDQMKANKGKTYFALSKDHLGVIDLFEIEMEWREKKEKEEGRSRMHVYKDYFWREPFVAERLQRLTGTLDDSGTTISHKVTYPEATHVFLIKAFYPSAQLRNRQVTFVLAFTWSGLRAFDVVENSESIASNGKSENGEKSREQNAVVVSKFRETDQLQRKLVPHDGDQDKATLLERISPKKSYDSDKRTRRNGDGTKLKDFHLQSSKNKPSNNGKLTTSPRQQTEYKSQKTNYGIPAGLLEEQRSLKSRTVTTPLDVQQEPYSLKRQENDVTPLISMSQFPKLVHDTPRVETTSYYDRRNFNVQDVPGEREKRKDDSHKTRQKQLDYAAVIKGIPENYLPDRQEVPDVTVTGACQKNEALASQTTCFDDNDYWDTLQKEVTSADWDIKGKRSGGYGGLDEISMSGTHEVHGTKFKKIETGLSITKDKESSKPSDTERLFLDEID